MEKLYRRGHRDCGNIETVVTVWHDNSHLTWYQNVIPEVGVQTIRVSWQDDKRVVSLIRIERPILLQICNRIISTILAPRRKRTDIIITTCGAYLLTNIVAAKQPRVRTN